MKPNNAQPGLETDLYEPFCGHLAVVENGEVTAYLRSLPFRPGIGFMLDHDFAHIVPESVRKTLHHPGSVELSRLVCAPNVELDPDGFHPVEHLLRLLYRLSAELGYWRFTIVVEEAWLRPFSRRFGLPFQVIGGPVTFPDGTRTVAAMATLDELEAGMRRHSAAKYAWYQEGLKMQSSS